MAKSKFSKMLEKINNNEETINSKEIEENDMSINSNVDIGNEEDDNIIKEEIEEYLEAYGSEFLGDDGDDDVEDGSLEIDNEYNKANDIDNNDGSILNDDELNDDLESNNSSEENNLKDKSKNKPENKTKKNSILYDMLSRSEGATLDELENKLGWKRASIRGVMSNLQKELKFCLLTIDVSKLNNANSEEEKVFNKETRYFIRDPKFSLDDTIIALFKIDDAFSKKDNNKDNNNL